MIRYSLSLLLLVPAALVVQQFIPTLTGLYHSQLYLITLVFLCGAVTASPPVMLMMAFSCGFLWDAHNHITTHVGDPLVYSKPAAMMPFGYSILLYAVIGYLMQGIRPLFRQGKWQVSTLLVGISIFVYLLADYLLINFVRGGFYLNRATLLKIWYSSVLTMLFSPLVFWMLFKLADFCGYRILLEVPRKGKKVERKRIYP